MLKESSWAQEFLAKKKLEREKQMLADMAEKQAKIQKRIDLLRKNKYTQDRPTKKRKVVCYYQLHNDHDEHY